MVTLDGTASIWIVGILCFTLGLVLGCIATYLVVARHGRTRRLQEELYQHKERFSDYRDQVTRHFMRTSELVQEMTHSYRAVYEHLASGAQHLCGDEIEAPRLNLPEEEPVATAGRVPGVVHAIDEDDIGELYGEAPRISDLDIRAGADKQTARH